MKTNILVIGSGISGLTYAIKVAGLNPQLNLVIISKNNLLESNTKYAQGGIAVVSNFQKDSFDKHVQDTLTAGAGACDEAVVRFVVEEGHERLNELIEWGAQFDTKSKCYFRKFFNFIIQSDPFIKSSWIKKIRILNGNHNQIAFLSKGFYKGIVLNIFGVVSWQQICFSVGKPHILPLAG